MSVLQPRSERLNLSFPVRFLSDGDTVLGSCVNVSSSGLFARFTRPLEIWTTGTVAIDTGRSVVTFKVRVARVVEHEAGLAFALATDADRDRLHDLVAFARIHTQLTTGRPPF